MELANGNPQKQPETAKDNNESPKIITIPQARTIPLTQGRKHYKTTTRYDSPKNLSAAYSEFDRAIGPADSLLGCELLHLVALAFHRARIPWVLFFGTLAGHAHFHGIIPWDDDWDVLALAPRAEVAAALRRFVQSHPRYAFKEVSSSFAKVFLRGGTRAGSHPWNWPFVDIFYSEPRGGKGQSVYVPFRRMTLPRGDILPVGYGYFQGLLYPVPRRKDAVLERLYKGSFGKLCYVWYDHKNERMRRPGKRADAEGEKAKEGGKSKNVKKKASGPVKKSCNFLRRKYGWVVRKSPPGKKFTVEFFVVDGEIKYRLIRFVAGGIPRVVIKF